MLKTVLCGATALLALAAGNASAAFVEYDLNAVTFSDGAVASGFFYQDTSNDAIVDYYINIPKSAAAERATFSPSGLFDKVSGTSRGFGGPGPSNFSVFDNLSEFYFYTLSLNFSRATANEVFDVTGIATQTPIPDLPKSAGGFSAQRSIVSGTVSEGTANPNILAFLESGGRDFQVLVPAEYRGNVPEPGSGALIALGLLGLAGALKRRVQ